MTPSAYCTACGSKREAGKAYCTACGAKHSAPPPVPVAATPPTPRPAPQPRALRCVECSSPIDAGLVCARCARGRLSPPGTAPSALPVSPAQAAAPRYAAPDPAPAPVPVPVPVQLVAQAPTPEPTQEGGIDLVRVVASLSFAGLGFTLRDGGGVLVVGLMVASVVGAAVFGMVVATIWGRPSGQNAFFAAVFAAFGCLLLVRLTTTPRIGVSMDDYAGGWVMLTGETEGGGAANAGIPVPSQISAIDGRTVRSSAEVQAIVARHRVFDEIRITAVSGIDPVFRNYDVVVGE